MMSHMMLTSQTLVGDLLAQAPGLVKFFFKKNLDCAGCAIEAFCTLEDVCRYYGYDIETFIKELEDHESYRDLDE